MLFLPILIFAAITAAIDGFTIQITPSLAQSHLRYEVDVVCSNGNRSIGTYPGVPSCCLVPMPRFPHPCRSRKYTITVTKYNPRNNNEVVGAKHTQFSVHIDDRALYSFQFQGVSGSTYKFDNAKIDGDMNEWILFEKYLPK